jgi:hypothetical protein
MDGAPTCQYLVAGSTKVASASSRIKAGISLHDVAVEQIGGEEKHLRHSPIATAAGRVFV